MGKFIERYFEAIWIGIALIVLTVVVFVPAFNVIYGSFFETEIQHGVTQSIFVGIKNYQLVFTDPYFWRFLYQNIIYTIGSVSLSFVLAFGCALLLNRIEKFKAFFRGMILLPWVIPPVVAAVFWRWLLNDVYGLVNALISIFGRSPVNWLGSPGTAMFSLIIVDAWTRVPFIAIYLLAGLQGISKEFYDAAEVDGAGGFERFKYITLPLLRPVITTVTLITFVFVFRTYEIIAGLTAGGPARSTETLTSYIFKTSVEYRDIGYSSALSVVVLLIVVLFSLFYLQAFYRGDSE